MKQKLSRWLLLGWLGVAMGQSSPPDLRWHPGAEDCEPGLQLTEARAFDETTIVIRQNPCIDYEANLLYLLIGDQRALLIDSGATDDPRLTAQLTGLVSRYLDRADGSRLPLVVAHSHGHQDHRAGDTAFAALPGTTVVPADGEGMRKFFGLQDWPDGGAHFELGNRRIELVPTPGHHPDHVVFIDSRTRLMFTGDFLLPGRLLVDDIDAYAESALRVIEAVNTWGTQYALGAHVEMNAAGELYASGASFHPQERALALRFATQDAVQLRQALRDFNGFYNRHADYAVVHPSTT
jgi:glyoxylase-like metal-dependent hydrolase (beta-lactamase superfamily II)